MKKGISAVFQLQSIIEQMKQAIVFNNLTGIAPGETKWIPVSAAATGVNGPSNADTTNVAFSAVSQATTFPFAGTIKNFFLWIDQELGITGAATITFYKNGTAQSITLVLGSGISANPVMFSDTINNFTVAAGDLIAIRIANDALSSNSIFGTFAFELDPS